MIYQAYLSSKASSLNSMHELYIFLNKESNLIKSFEKWMEFVIGILESFEKNLPSTEITESIMKEIELKIK